MSTSRDVGLAGSATLLRPLWGPRLEIDQLLQMEAGVDIGVSETQLGTSCQTLAVLLLGHLCLGNTMTSVAFFRPNHSLTYIQILQALLSIGH